MGLLELLITLIIFALVLWLLFYLFSRLAIPEPVRTVILVLAALIIIVVVVNRFGLLAGF